MDTQQKTPQQLMEEQEYPSPTETSLYNTLTGAGIYIRDDGCISIQTGTTYILIDGESGQITLNGDAIATNSTTTTLNTNPGGIAIGEMILNPTWYSKSVPNLDNSPMTAKLRAISTTFLTAQLGATEPVPVRFSDLFNTVPLFLQSTRSLEHVNSLEAILEESV